MTLSSRIQRYQNSKMQWMQFHVNVGLQTINTTQSIVPSHRTWSMYPDRGHVNIVYVAFMTVVVCSRSNLSCQNCVSLFQPVQLSKHVCTKQWFQSFQIQAPSELLWFRYQQNTRVSNPTWDDCRVSDSGTMQTIMKQAPSRIIVCGKHMHPRIVSSQLLHGVFVQIVEAHYKPTPHVVHTVGWMPRHETRCTEVPGSPGA